MSWQSYVDDQLIKTKMVKHAAIFGHDGTIWAKDADFEITVDEAKAILSDYGNTEELAKKGITVAGQRYMFLSCSDKIIRGKSGTKGVHSIKTNQAVILTVYDDPIVPEQAATVTEKLGEFLISVGY